MSVEAVRTTGIYCHPTCSATPNPRNVVTFAVAAAAEAEGFRACLRCRPYRGAPSFVEGPELVCRAVRLVVDGALDQSGEADLAARLGVSARHLRRLFDQHVGATPDQLARSRRAHFARRLLDDTDLPIVEIAYASGFGSARQMGRVMQAVFHESPTALRARRRRSDRLVADGGLETRLPHEPPLDWDDLLAFFAARAVPGVESVCEGIYRRTIDVDGSPGVVEVRRGDDRHLVATWHLPRWEGLIHLVQRLRRVFDLDRDPEATAAVLGDDPHLSPWPAGLRVPGSWDPFESGVRAILGQQVSVQGARTTAGKIAEAHGRDAPGLDAFGLRRRFPRPDDLASADLPIPDSRARAVRAFARAHASGDLPLDGSADLEELERRLCELPGIGPWTAQYLALRLGYLDAFPASDLGVLKALGDRDARRAAVAAERWRPQRAAAVIRLWRKQTES